MKKTKRIISLALSMIFAASLLLISCSSSDSSSKEMNLAAGNEGYCIPNDAVMVASVNIGSVWKKGELDNFTNLETVKAILEEMKEEEPVAEAIISGIFNDPQASGIDTNENMVMFVTKDNDGDAVAALEFVTLDKKKFEGFVNDLAALDNRDPVTLYDDDTNKLTYSYLDNVVVMFDDSKIMFLWTEDTNITTTQFIDLGIDIFRLKPENSMGNDDVFKEYWRNRGDASIFTKCENYAGTLALLELMVGMPKNFVRDLSNLAVYWTVTFENDGIGMRFNTIGMPEAIKKIGDQKFNTDLVKYMPQETFIAGTIAINTDNLVEFIGSFKEVAKSLNEPIEYKGYQVKDAIKAFGGSMAISYYGMVNHEDAAIACAIDVKDKDIVEYLMQDANVEYCFIDDVMIFSTDKEVISKAKKGGYSKGMGTIAKDAKAGNYVYMELDTEKMPKSIKGLIDESFVDYDYDDYTDSFEEIYDEEGRDLFYKVIGAFSNADAKLDSNGIGAKLRTTNKSGNSLAYILKSLDKIIAERLD